MRRARICSLRGAVCGPGSGHKRKSPDLRLQIGALLLKRTAVRDQQGQTKLPLLIKDGDIAQICSAASRASPVARTALPGALAASPITSTWPATFSAVSFKAVLEREPMASTMLS